MPSPHRVYLKGEDLPPTLRLIAGIESLETEPHSPDNPLLRLKLDNLIVTPHVAWASQRSLANLAEQLIQNLVE